MKLEIYPRLSNIFEAGALKFVLTVEKWHDGVYIPDHAEVKDQTRIELEDPDFIFWCMAISLIYGFRKDVLLHNIIKDGIFHLRDGDDV